MRAVLARGPRDFELIETDNPTLSGNGAVIRVEAAGVCAADRMLWRGDGPWSISYPFVPGHEIVGRIDSLTPAAGARWGVRVGDRVAVEVMVPCEACTLCAEGRENLCRSGAHLGSDLPGAFADLIAVPARARVHLVPEHVPLRSAAAVETLANAVHAVRRADVQPTDVVAIIGIGAVGAAVLKALKASVPTAQRIAVVRREERAAVALELGATDVVVLERCGETGAAAQLRAASDELGPARVVELSGSASALRLALDVVRPGGRVCLYGVYAKPVQIDANLVAEFKELTVVGGHLAPNGAFGEAIRLLSDGSVDMTDVVTEIYPLEDYRRSLESAPRVKTVLAPNPEAGTQVLELS